MSHDEEGALFSQLRSPNLLLIGPDAATREFLAPLMATFVAPVVYCEGATPEFPAGPVCTLIVRDVARLTRTHQQQLLEWLNDRGGSAQVIATSARPVFPSVVRGSFSDSLYYRLNTVTLVLNRRRHGRHVGHAERVGLFEPDALGI
jgi:sigma-54-interacting transcriptional regulator